VAIVKSLQEIAQPCQKVFGIDAALQAAEEVAQPLLAVRFSGLSRIRDTIHRENRTARSGCATNTFPESTFSAAYLTTVVYKIGMPHKLLIHSQSSLQEGSRLFVHAQNSDWQC
jgi:hypothetical protein